MDWLRVDLRHALRGLRARPGLAAVMIVTLAAGLGVNTVALAVVDALFVAPTRRPYAREIGWLFVGSQQAPLAGSSLTTYEHLREHSRTIRDLAAEGRLPVAIMRDGIAEQVWALVVSENYFSLLSVTPAAGRLLAPSDASAPGLPIVISERYWRQHYAADPALDRISLTISRQPATVVGVVPGDFQGPGGLYAPDLWAPLTGLDRPLGRRFGRDEAATRWLTLIGRPAPDVEPAEVEADMRALAMEASTSQPGEAPPAVRFVPLAEGHPELGEIRPALFAVVAVTMTLLLVVACFNVAGLTLARAVERRRDVALHAALGATPARLIRLMATESGLVAVLAGLAALLIVLWSEPILGLFAIPAPIPQRLPIAVSGRLIAMTSALVALAALLPVAVPAWQIARRDLLPWLRQYAPGSAGGFGQRPRRVLVQMQVAGSMLFVALGLLLTQSLVRALAFDPGFETARVALLEVNPSLRGHDAASARLLAERLVDRLRTDAAVDMVALADRLPFYVGYPDRRAISTEAAPCDPEACPTAVGYAVSGTFFETMGIPLITGRTFDDRNAADTTAVVVNQTAAARFWPDGPAVGQSFREGPDARGRVVVGVAADVTHRGFGEPPQPAIYRPLTEADLARPFTVVARSAGEAATLEPVLHGALRAVEPDLPPALVSTMRRRMALPLWYPRVTAGFFGFCGLLAMLLATVGLFGATWYAVARRTREFGVRLALGARASDLRRLVIGEGLRLALPGVVAGTAVAAGLATLGRSLLVGLSPLDPVTYAAAVVIQIGAVLIANWWPARRAARVDPMRALTAE